MTHASRYADGAGPRTTWRRASRSALIAAPASPSRSASSASPVSVSASQQGSPAWVARTSPRSSGARAASVSPRSTSARPCSPSGSGSQPVSPSACASSATARSSGSAPSRSPRSRASRPSWLRAQTATSGAPRARALATTTLEDRLGCVVLAAVDPAAAEREGDLVLDPRVERAARGGEPALGARIAPGELVDVGEGEPSARGGLAPVGPVGEQDRAVQVDDDLVLRAAPGVEAGEREREPRLRLERVVAARAGGGDGLAQAADPGVDGAGAQRRLAGLELRPRVRAGAHVARRRPGRDRADPGPGRAAELAAQQRVEGVVLALGAVDVAGRGERADQDRLRVLVERVDRDEARGVVGGGVGRGGGEARARGLGEHGLGGGLQVAALVRQPHVERRARREVHALEEVAPRPGARAASAQSPERTAWTSTNVPGGRASATGDPRSAPGSSSRRRSSLRFQRRAPSGSSASATAARRGARAAPAGAA